MDTNRICTACFPHDLLFLLHGPGTRLELGEGTGASTNPKSDLSIPKTLSCSPGLHFSSSRVLSVEKGSEGKWERLEGISEAGRGALEPQRKNLPHFRGCRRCCPALGMELEPNVAQAPGQDTSWQ